MAHRSFSLPAYLTKCSTNYPPRRFLVDLAFVAQRYLDSLLPRTSLLPFDCSRLLRSIPITTARVCSVDQSIPRTRLGRLPSRNPIIERSENPSTRLRFKDHQTPCDCTESGGTTQTGTSLLEVDRTTAEQGARESGSRGSRVSLESTLRPEKEEGSRRSVGACETMGGRGGYC